MLIKIANYNLSDIEDSVKFLLDRAANSPEVRDLAIQITHDKQDKIKAVYDWVKSSVAYVPDPVSEGGEEIELFTSPVKLVRDYKAGNPIGEDCDGQAILATSLYRSIGIRANVVIIDSAGNGLDHAYCQVWSDKLSKYINCDPTSAYPLGWDFSYKSKIIVD